MTETAPKPESQPSTWFRKIVTGGPHKTRADKIHMRHIFQVAILVEEQGVEFYTKLAEKSSEESVKKLCSQLASDEAEHKELFQNVLSRWTPLPADQQSLDSLIQELRNAGLFSDIPPTDASETDLMKYAIEQEKKTADFYLSFEKAFPSEWKSMHIRQLVMTERAHANSLLSLVSQNM